MKRLGHGPAGLELLLDSLEGELLAASTEELRDALRETGRAHDVACREIRSLLHQAATASEDEPATVPSGVGLGGILHRH
jgi:hypothetical protein